MTSRIEAGITIEGSIRGEGELEVAGRVRGALTIAGKLTVEDGGIVEADVEATSIEVSGLLSGSATAHEQVVVRDSGRVEARVRAPKMLIDEGAVFRGELQSPHDDHDGVSGHRSLPAPHDRTRAGRARQHGANPPAHAKTSVRTPGEHETAPRPSRQGRDERAHRVERAPTNRGHESKETQATSTRGRAPGFAAPPRTRDERTPKHHASGSGDVTSAPTASMRAAEKLRGHEPPKMPTLPKGRTQIKRRGES